MLKFNDGGLRNVWLANGYEVKRTPYGEAVAVRDADGLAHHLCSALARKPGRLTGSEFRYLRQHLRLSQGSLGRLMGVTEQAVALWEKRSRIPLLADKHLRLLWAEKHNGNEPVARAMERLNVVERLLQQRLVMRSSPRKGWRVEVAEEEA